jgi:hypothetical protein
MLSSPHQRPPGRASSQFAFGMPDGQNQQSSGWLTCEAFHAFKLVTRAIQEAPLRWHTPMRPSGPAMPGAAKRASSVVQMSATRMARMLNMIDPPVAGGQLDSTAHTGSWDRGNAVGGIQAGSSIRERHGNMNKNVHLSVLIIAHQDPYVWGSV